MKTDIIIDCDPGHDDAIALFLALGNPKKLNILGISTVAGNQTLDKVTKNTLNLIDALKMDIPIVSGSSKPLKIELRTAGDFHGETGMDGPLFEENSKKVISFNSIKWMYETIQNNKKKVSIVAIGPLTNIAKLLKKYPKIKEKIEVVSFMGGSLGSGNITATAEFNIWQDPHAAEYVFKSGIKLVMANLEATEKANLPWDYIDILKYSNSFKRLIWELMDFYGKFGRRINKQGAELHDALAMYYLLGEYKCKTTSLFIDVEVNNSKTFGQTFSDTRRWSTKKPNIEMITNFSSEDFFNELKGAFDFLDKEVIGGKYGMMKK